MNNLIKYDEFINEWYKSRYNDAVKKVIEYIKIMDVNDIEMGKTNYSDQTICKFILHKKEENELDPYGEENWEDQREPIRVKIHLNDSEYYGRLYLNNIDLNITHSEGRKITRVIRRKLDEKKQKDIGEIIKNL